MKAITFTKPVVQNGKLIIENFEQMYNALAKANPDYTIIVGHGIVPKDHKIMEWDLENGEHIIMIDFLDGQGIMLSQRLNDYKLAD